MMSFAVLSRTRQQCGSSSSPETPRSSWAVFESQRRGDITAPAPPIKIRWFIWTMCPPCWWALTLQVCHQHLPSSCNRAPVKLPGICTWFQNLCSVSILVIPENTRGLLMGGDLHASHYMWSHASELWETYLVVLVKNQFPFFRATKTGLKTYK